MATTKIKIGNVKGAKGDPYVLNDGDKKQIAEAVKASLTSESWTFTLEDGSVITKEVVLK